MYWNTPPLLSSAPSDLVSDKNLPFYVTAFPKAIYQLQMFSAKIPVFMTTLLLSDPD